MHLGDLGWRSIVGDWAFHLAGLVAIVHFMCAPIPGLAYAWLAAFFAPFEVRAGGLDMLR